MTVPEPTLATVTMNDGTVHYGLYLESPVSSQLHPVPHDPDVPSPLWLDNRDVKSVEFEQATP
jgi:hypothetical protein